MLWEDLEGAGGEGGGRGDRDGEDIKKKKKNYLVVNLKPQYICCVLVCGSVCAHQNTQLYRRQIAVIGHKF